MEKNVVVNHLPVLTWNKLGLNDARVTIQTVGDSVDNSSGKHLLPQGVSLKSGVSWDNLNAVIEELGIDNPKEVIVAGKVPMYNEQKFATGMGSDVDGLLRDWKIGTDIYTIEEGYQTGEPVRLQYDYPVGVPDMSSIFIHAKAGSSSTFIIDYTGGGNQAWIGSSVRVYLEEGASVQLYKVQMLSKDATFFDDVGAVSEKKSEFTLSKLHLGAGHVYDGCNECQVGDRSRFRVDFGTICLPDTTMDMNYNDVFIGKKAEGVMRFHEALLGNAKKTFRGTVDFRQNSTGSVGDEQEDVLLFGEDIVNCTIPLILCEEEDVDGRHAATIGRLSEEMLFYMNTRCLTRKQAEKLMVRANIRHISSQIPDEEIRARVEQYINEVFEED